MRAKRKEKNTTEMTEIIFDLESFIVSPIFNLKKLV